MVITAPANFQIIATYPGVNPRWPAETIEALIVGWNAGLSSGQLAAQLNRTRNSIIGKLVRLRQKGVMLIEHEADCRPKTIDHKSSKNVRGGQKKVRSRPEKSTSKIFTAAASPEIMAKARELAEADVEAFSRPITGGVKSEDLDQHHCRWPLGDPLTKEFRHCGEQRAPGISYCPSCAKRAFPQLTTLQLTAMSLMCKDLQDARMNGRPSPFPDQMRALRDCQESLKLSAPSPA